MIHRSENPVPTRDLLVLAVLSDEPLHGYGLVTAIEDRSDGSVSIDPANLYRLLRRMREAGWIEDVPSEGYTRRRTHRITPVGRRVLRAETARLTQLLHQLGSAGG